MFSLPTGFCSGGGGDPSDEGTAQEAIREEIAMTRERHKGEQKAKGRADRKDSEEIGPGPIDPGRKDVDDGRQHSLFWAAGGLLGRFTAFHSGLQWSIHTWLTAYFLLSANLAELNFVGVCE